jgi:excinuclease ABC subunit C
MQKLYFSKEKNKILLKNLPVDSGIYSFLDKEKKIIYIGKAKNLKKRVNSYFVESSKRTSKIENLISKSAFLDLTLTNNELEALLLEQHLIKKHLPAFNVQFRDDKGYPWIKIDSYKNFPSATSFLGKKDSNSSYYGPFPSSYAVRETLSLIQKTFKLRNCNENFFKNRDRPCMQYQIGRCSAPCVGIIEEKEYLDNVKEAQLLFDGKGEDLIKYLYEEMDIYSSNKDYEKAASYRDKISALRDIQRNQSISGFFKDTDAIVSISSLHVTKIGVTHVKGGWIIGHDNFTQREEGLYNESLESFIIRYYLAASSCPERIIVGGMLKNKDFIEESLSKHHSKAVKLIVRPGQKDKGLISIARSNTQLSLRRISKNEEDLSDLFNSLKEKLGLKKSFLRLESYDISHFSGDNAIGACVVYGPKGKLKKDYRLFNINKKNSGNDIASMQEVIERRFRKLDRQKKDLPILIILDGGLTHIRAVRKILKLLDVKSIALMALSKGARRKADFDSIHLEDGSKYRVNNNSKIDLFLQEVRDETHRFAISNQKKKQEKSFLSSSLEAIPGVGKKKQILLLRFFGSYDQIKRASPSDLQNVAGISLKTADKIYNFLH